MRQFRTVEDWRQHRAACGGTLGFVPTMGGLHEGHASLVRRARAENEQVVVSIFLNPTQFNNAQDLAGYPATLEADLALLEQLGVDALLAPPKDVVYRDGFRFRVEENQFSRRLCGAHRPGHFTGVLTVVMKLLNLVRPHRAYFGRKDYQQLRLIQDMVDAFFMDVAIVPCATVRDADGLALSSRNALLDDNARRLAPRLREMLCSPAADAEVAEALADLGFEVDYVATLEDRRLAAASLRCNGQAVRLIDNVGVAEHVAVAGESEP